MLCCQSKNIAPNTENKEEMNTEAAAEYSNGDKIL